MSTIVERLSRIEEALNRLVQKKTEKEWNTTAEFSELVDRAEWTVREWCRTGRINAEKRPCGRGRSKEWMISCDELARYRNQGLLPDPRLIRKRE